MKRREFIRRLEHEGCELARSGGKHDLYRNPATGAVTTVPRHSELGNTLCKEIRKQLGLKA
ncbi:MAG: type II toxin-antitoxin system HicA family toxin [Nitrospira sp.]